MLASTGSKDESTGPGEDRYLVVANISKKNNVKVREPL
jgi:hypothetical protein